MLILAGCSSLSLVVIEGVQTKYLVLFSLGGGYYLVARDPQADASVVRHKYYR